MQPYHPFNQDDRYFPLGVCIEGLLHGFYTALFVAALWIWKKRRSQTEISNFSTNFYLAIIIMMWLVGSLHLGTCIWQLLRIYILELSIDGPPISIRLVDTTKWEIMASMSLLGIMIWLGDILVIYRAYVVWDRNWYAVILPVILNVANVVVYITALYFFSHPATISRKQAFAWHKPLFPLLCVQNIMTSGLLCYKIWSQHGRSTKGGVVHTGGTLSLSYVARMLIETAMFYTIELLLLTTLTVLHHPAKSIFILTLVPTVGIIFVLLSVRIHVSGMVDTRRTITVSNFPDWLGSSEATNDNGSTRPPSVTSTDHVEQGVQTGHEEHVRQHSASGA